MPKASPRSPSQKNVLTEKRDLRSGNPCWVAPEMPLVPDRFPESVVDVAIIGSGVMGAMLAERLSAAGLGTALFDRRPPAEGSTAASTALVTWAADVPLTHLARRIGMEGAVERWRRVQRAVGMLAERIDALGLDVELVPRPELYLAGSLLDADGLEEEAQARLAAGFPSVFLGGGAVEARFGVKPSAGLLSTGGHQLDPVRLTHALLQQAQRRGATISWPADIVSIRFSAGEWRLKAVDGREAVARTVILATGYERARRYLPPAFKVISSYAVATPPGTAPLWEEDAMIWEASDPYFYARTSSDGRVIVGGEDISAADPGRRDRLIEAKAAKLLKTLARISGVSEVPLDCAWAASFGSSPDGLPAIGRVPRRPGLWLASGFGGNGISFAALAADLIAADLAGHADPHASFFDPRRFDA